MPHYTGLIIRELRRHTITSGVSIDNHQQNGAYGVHQARVRLEKDPTVYRLILAPSDAPIEIGGRPIGEHFSLPLGAG